MNKLIVASAGSGKTRLILRKAVEQAERGETVLITTYTEACEQDIIRRIVKKEGCVPRNIVIQTWFSFLIRHGVKPFQGQLFQADVRGMILVNGKSGFRFNSRGGQPVYWGEKDFEKYYFTTGLKIYSDKLAQLVMACNEASDGMVFDRISRCFSKIFVDEVQDLAGYDLEILNSLFAERADVVLVGDPRQATYSTSNARKHKKYLKANIVNFFADESPDLETDDTSLRTNYRCGEAICSLADRLYPNMPASASGNSEVTGHDGVFALVPGDVQLYLNAFEPMQLRDSVKTQVYPDWPVLNFGKSKGRTCDRVLIYPSGPMIRWLKDNGFSLTQAARAKLYVAVTRARRSVAFVLAKNDIEEISDLPVYRPLSIRGGADQEHVQAV